MSGSQQTDEKTERLLNLVLALLGTRRFLKKSEIIKMIPGYEGSPEARERMFERDKDELRKIGILIEVNQLDPLFEDEVGYRISRSNYVTNFPRLTAEEGLVANLALQLVSKIGIKSDIRSALMRLGALSATEESEIEKIFAQSDFDESAPTFVIATCISAIKERRELHFLYQRELDGERSERQVRPLRLEMRAGLWHLVAFDVVRNAYRVFLIDNILGQPQLSTVSFDAKTLPKYIESTIPTTQLLVHVTHPRVPLLELEGGVPRETKGSKTLMEFNVYDVERTLRILIGIDAQAEILEPTHLVSTFAEIREGIFNAIR